jgi:hypothetical protein
MRVWARSLDLAETAEALQVRKGRDPMTKLDYAGIAVIALALAIIVWGRIVRPVVRFVRSRWEVRALDRLRVKDSRAPLKDTGPVTVYDWTAYGNHLGACTACSQDKPHCDTGVQLWRGAMKTATVVKGASRGG